VTGRNGDVHELHSEIDREEGEFLRDIIRNDPSILKTLEVGCAYGLSSLHICAALKERDGASHTIIDPFQDTQWDGAGVRNLEDAGIEFFELLQEKSEISLPRLLERMEGEFDLIFVDGWHTFDHTLVDCFYATRLLRIGGYLVLDDVDLPSVGRVVELLKSYPCYEIHGTLGHAVPKTWKKLIARSVLAPVDRETLSELISRTLYRSIFDDKTIRMIALRKTTQDSRNWDWHDDAF
jgi:predicted O-methyltransferase YrrM